MGRVCPWWQAYTFDHALRRIVHNPEKILGPYLKEGMTVLDIGCGMGFFSIAMARMLGTEGKVIALDLQPQMIRVLKKRAEKAEVAGSIITHICEPGNLGINETADFILAFYMVHEMPDQASFLTQVASCLKPGAKFLLVEPVWHVSRTDFHRTMEYAANSGLKLSGNPRITLSHTALFIPG